MTFDAFIFADWSARANRGGGPDSVWVGEWCSDGIPQSTRNPQRESIHAGGTLKSWNIPIRASATEFMMKRSSELVAIGKRVMLGIDCGYGYPAPGLTCQAALDAMPEGYATTLGQLPIWKATWGLVSLLQPDDDANDSSTRWGVANWFNQNIPDSTTAGPFWAHAKGQATAHLENSSPGFPYGPLQYSAKRITEVRAGSGAQPQWKLYTSGSVGSQTLCGMMRLFQMRFPTNGIHQGRFGESADLEKHSLVWPFETDFAGRLPPSGPLALHAEIFPSVNQAAASQLEVAHGLVRDQAQVEAMCMWAVDEDAAGRLVGNWLAQPANLDQQQLQDILAIEGWILGVA